MDVSLTITPRRPRRTRVAAGPALRIARRNEKPTGGLAVMDARVAADIDALTPRILDAVRGHGDGLSFRAIAQALGRRDGKSRSPVGGHSHSRFVQAIELLGVSRRLVRLFREKATCYRLPVPGEDWGSPVTQIPVPPFDAAALREAVHTALQSRRACSLSELVSLAREVTVHATTETVEAALRELFASGQARAVAFGAFTRYEAVRAS